MNRTLFLPSESSQSCGLERSRRTRSRQAETMPGRGMGRCCHQPGQKGHLDCERDGHREDMNFNLEARNGQLRIISKEESATFVSITRRPHNCIFRLNLKYTNAGDTGKEKSCSSMAGRKYLFPRHTHRQQPD